MQRLKASKRTPKSSSFRGFSCLPFFSALLKDIGGKSRDLQTLNQRFGREGFAFFTKTFPIMSKAIDRGLADRKFKLPTNFKRSRRGSEIPALCGSLFLTIFDHDGVLLDAPSVRSVRLLRQFFGAAYKANYKRKALLDELVLKNFVSTEHEIGQVNAILKNSFFKGDDPVLNQASTLIKELMKGFDCDDESFVPKHGPGSTSNCPYDARNDYLLNPDNLSSRAFKDFFYLNAEDEKTERRTSIESPRSDFGSCNPLYAKVILVPKDSRGPRLISCEPFESMFIQQAIMSFMTSRAERHTLTSGHVNFSDQSVNQSLAHKASTTKYWSTLDLKDASDRIAYWLMVNLFYSSDVFSILDLTRSTYTTLPCGTLHKLEKFAPMGSACCFPVLALSIWALTVSSLVLRGYPLKMAREMIYVYGDDIIVPSKHAHFISDVLTRYGLKVNLDKSFINSSFAESCGTDSFMGETVTPVRVRNVEKDDSAVVSILNTARQLDANGYSNSAEYLYDIVECRTGKLPFSTDRAPYLGRFCTDLAPERNIFLEGLKWKPVNDRQRYPHGRLLRACGVHTRKYVSDVSPYSHMMRTLPILGADLIVATYGEFVVPRSVVIRRGLYDHYDMD
jgi:hypothetical protein